jgi:hypothetical protein
VGTEITSIPKVRQVYYCAFADFPATANEGDLAYATDTLRLYRMTAGVWQPITAASATTSGSYAGNSSVNRAIAHGLGVIPKIVFIWDDTDADRECEIFGAVAKIICFQNTPKFLAVTAPDVTNFFVGNATAYGYSANLTGVTYYWVAIG